MSKKNKSSEGITVSKEKDIVEWYSQVFQKAELADYAPTKGFMIIRPRGYAIWEAIQQDFNKTLKRLNVKNAYFPLVIPESFFKREAEHAEGFSPELAYIEGTGKDGEDRLALRPTSETIMYDSYSRWIRSWKDLPLKINQWSNTIRWEVKQTKPFLRTREFLWQEGHCVFESEKEAKKNQEEIIKEYAKLAKDLLALPSIVGKKSKLETFAGSKDTLTFEMLMSDGKALQAGTSHNLGQNFAKAFNVKFKDKDEKDQYAWQTSWGISTRLIGALIMVHGDDSGLVLPPSVAREKCVIVPIFNKDNKDKVLKKAEEIRKKLNKWGTRIDDREGYSPGWKFSEWELKGVPIRVEIGPKDIEKKQVTLVRRDTGKKEQVKEGSVAKKVDKMLDDIQDNLYNKAEKFLKSRITSADSMVELKKKLKEGKIVKAYMVDDSEVEEQIKTETGGATSRIIESVKKKGKCVQSGRETNILAYIAKSY
tara:strand:+ start:4546 stop:5985 length:1440 start_codon:yes stop_codon:yes gene_type:complete